MVGRIDTAYSGIARKLHVELAPVGGAFVRAWRTDPAVPLWGADGSHPTLAGSYMAACVLYGAITGRDPRESTYVPFPLDARFAANIRAVAAASLSDVPRWPGGDVLPPSSITTGIAANSSGAPPELSKSARTTTVSAKLSRPQAKPPETGHVAATIADFLGRAPGQTDAPIAGRAEPSGRPSTATPAAASSAGDAVSPSAPESDGAAAPIAPAFLDDVTDPPHDADAPTRVF
jgi:hypothetical protein